MTILGLISYRKDLECAVPVQHYATEVHTSNNVNDVTLYVTFELT